jgi:hypothetical protein
MFERTTGGGQGKPKYTARKQQTSKENCCSCKFLVQNYN